MSGTTGTVGTTAIPHVVSVGRLRRAPRRLKATVRRLRVAGGLPTVAALPMAATITAAIAWLIISFASTWVTV